MRLYFALLGFTGFYKVLPIFFLGFYMAVLAFLDSTRFDGFFFFGRGGGLEFMFRLHLRSPIWQSGELRVEIVHLSDRFIAGGGNKERLHSLFLDFTLYSFNSFVVPGHEALGPLPTDGSIVVSFSCFLSLFPFFFYL